jgi:hypothetical protein
MLNGNVGVMKSMMAELTDDTNMARGSSLIAVTWAVGGTLGSDISLLSFVYCLISRLLDPSLVVCYRDHKIVGQIFSPIIFGANTRTSYHVSRPPYMLSCHFLWLRFS